jgi:hypothetical protein
MQAVSDEQQNKPVGPHDSPTGVAGLYNESESPAAVEGQASVIDNGAAVEGVVEVEPVVEGEAVVEGEPKEESVVEGEAQVQVEGEEQTPVEGEEEPATVEEGEGEGEAKAEGQESETESQMVSVEKPDKLKKLTNKYEYTIESALYLRNKFTRTKKQTPIDKWDDSMSQKWRTKTLKTLVSILKLANNKQTYKTHHRQLDKYRNTMNRVLNDVNKVKVSGTKKKK